MMMWMMWMMRNGNDSDGDDEVLVCEMEIWDVKALRAEG